MSRVQQAACASVLDAIVTVDIDPGFWPFVEPLQNENTAEIDVEPLQNENTAEIDVEPLEGVKAGLLQSISILEALISYTEYNRGTPAASPVVEAMLYVEQVMDALRSMSDQGVRILTSEGPGVPADATIEVDGRRVRIEIKWAATPELQQRSIDMFVNRLKHQADTEDFPHLVIAPHAYHRPIGRGADQRIAVSRWNSPEDTETLVVALRSLARL